MAGRRPDPQRLAALKLLHERAVEHARELARALGEARARRDQAAQQLGSVQQFSVQYRAQLGALEAAGSSWAQLRDLRAFIARLDAACEAQRQELARIDVLQAQRGREWAEARQREKAYAMLIERHDEASRTYEQQRAWQEMQEWSVQASSAASSAASGTAS